MCRAGDVLVATKLDRLARSLWDATDIADELTNSAKINRLQKRTRIRLGVAGVAVLPIGAGLGLSGLSLS